DVPTMPRTVSSQFPYTTHFRSVEQSLRRLEDELARAVVRRDAAPLRRLLSEEFVATDCRGQLHDKAQLVAALEDPSDEVEAAVKDRKSTRLNSSYAGMSDAFFC